jgi:hypothetical protein
LLPGIRSVGVDLWCACVLAHQKTKPPTHAATRTARTTKTVAFFAVEQRLGSCWWWGNPRVVIAVVFVVGAASALFLHSSSHQQSQKTNAANYEYSRKCRRTTFVVANGGRDDDRWGHI